MNVHRKLPKREPRWENINKFWGVVLALLGLGVLAVLALGHLAGVYLN